ncbi:hypothetical protein CKO40_21070 [Halochromatium glycolicum]|uniref:Uncharacterized protein n=2 Tax=Halochromatium glycolicum TaxID=85075 RepID=A0AAJ0U7W8_9GAMM|nr:hypothetical protein [Halochromatium glycolicum]
MEPRDERLRQWHRLFGIALMEVFEGAPWRVELEQALALRSQLLDVAIIEATGEGAVRASGVDCPLASGREGHPEPPAAQCPLELPDGLENLRPHNLLTYKSQHEALTAWTLDELIGHYVNYRKLRLNPDGQRHRQDAFGLYAVATRFPKALQREHPLTPTAWEGVYELPWGGHQVRLIVLNAIAKHARNAPWELFASEQDRIRQGLIHYRARHPHPSQGGHQGGHWELLERLHLIYQRENLDMAYTMEDFLRETHELVLANMTLEERLKGLAADEVLQRYDPEERLKGLEPKERLKGLEPEERLKGLDPATIEAWLAKQRGEH